MMPTPTRLTWPVPLLLALGLAHLSSPPGVLAAGVVGTGSAASCTDGALNTALAGGGLVTFNCGGGLVTININPKAGGTGGKNIAVDTTVDGGGVVTISGGNVPAPPTNNLDVGIFYVNNGVKFTVQNLTIANGAGFVGGIGVGGIFNNGGTLTVTNSTFSGNSTSGGGAIDNYGTLTVINSTFSGNSATGAGSAIDNISDGIVTLTNTIVANSISGGNCAGTITDGGHNLDDGTTCGFTAANGSLNNTNPSLDPAELANNGGPTQTIALQVGSPAINAGNETVCSAPPVNNLDQRYFARPGEGARVAPSARTSTTRFQDTAVSARQAVQPRPTVCAETVF